MQLHTRNFFPLIKENKVWIGYDNVKEFKKPDGTIQKFGNIGWYTNIDIDKRHENIELTARYNDEDYPEYDNFKAININRVNEIPMDYKGVMGVPISFLDKYNPEQFEIVGITNHGDMLGIEYTTNCFAEINKKRCYVRVLIKRKQQKSDE